MGRLWQMAATGVLLVFMLTMAATGYAQSTPDEFVAVAPGELQEQLPAAPLVFAAYGIVWLAFAFYAFSVWTRVRQVEAELRVVAAKLEKSSR